MVMPSRLTTPSFLISPGLDIGCRHLADVRDRAELMRAYTTAGPISFSTRGAALVGMGYSTIKPSKPTSWAPSTCDCVRRGVPRSSMTTDKSIAILDSGIARMIDWRPRPYGGSVCCEMVAEVYARSFPRRSRVSLATVRAGTLSWWRRPGEGPPDPDAIRAWRRSAAVDTLSDAARPWQHVLDAAQPSAGGATRRRSPAAWNVVHRWPEA